MRMFFVKEGTRCLVKVGGGEPRPYNLKVDQYFQVEDITRDPIKGANVYGFHRMHDTRDYELLFKPGDVEVL